MGMLAGWMREAFARAFPEAETDFADIVVAETSNPEFGDYQCNAAMGLAKPSSAARALFAGAPNIERVDRVVKSVAAQQGMHNDTVDEIVAMVDARLEMNREKVA